MVHRGGFESNYAPFSGTPVCDISQKNRSSLAPRRASSARYVPRSASKPHPVNQARVSSRISSSWASAGCATIPVVVRNGLRDIAPQNALPVSSASALCVYIERPRKMPHEEGAGTPRIKRQRAKFGVGEKTALGCGTRYPLKRY